MQTLQERLLKLDYEIEELERQIALSETKGMKATLQFYLDGLRDTKKFLAVKHQNNFVGYDKDGFAIYEV